MFGGGFHLSWQVATGCDADSEVLSFKWNNLHTSKYHDSKSSHQYGLYKIKAVIYFLILHD